MKAQRMKKYAGCYSKDGSSSVQDAVFSKLRIKQCGLLSENV